MTRAGYRTLPARTGGEAIELMRVTVPDLAILDLRMPGLSGTDVLKYLHDSPVLRHVPVLIVSGYLEDVPPDAAAGLNVVGRLPKPLTFEELVEAVQAALERPAPLHPAAVAPPPGA